MPESEDGDSNSRFQSPVRNFAIHKTRSSGNLPQHTLSKYNSAPGRSSSPDPGAKGEPLAATRSKTLIDQEHGIIPSGLHRIRQQPPLRQQSTPMLDSRSTSMTIQLPEAESGTLSKPISPLLTTSDDLMRFPTESLHSFSFAQKSSDFIQMRQNVMKRSMDILKDRSMWAAGGLGTANAQAKVTGDQEAQSMFELMDKAHLLGSDRLGPAGLGHPVAPLTGPAHTSLDDIFDKSFMQRAESPEPMTAFANAQHGEPEPDTRSPQTPSLTVDIPGDPPRYSGGEPLTAPEKPAPRPNATLKRTYTDVAPLSLQNKLSEALAQPYMADDTALLSPIGFNESGSSAFPGFSPHAHGRNTPMSQAIFSTDAESPYTISAANDLACLAFGVQKAEIRKLSILDVIREDKRLWLENKLRGPRPPAKSTVDTSPNLSRTSAMGSGLTARLLSKPSSRETSRSQQPRSLSASASPTIPRSDISMPTKSRCVLLCGDVIPVQKRNGDAGSATVWVQEKRDKLIWVLEEIAEDVATLAVDEIGCITTASGKTTAIWAMDHVRRGMDVTKMIPDLPRLEGTNTGALDYERIAQHRRFTARTSNDIRVPITIDQIPAEPAFRVSSFPHIAGMMVVSASTLEISSSNTVVSEALFGRSPNGMSMNELIPHFDKMLATLVEEDELDLVEGMVIPEQSFRQARAMLAIREGRADAAAVFLRPNGLPAIHRDGAQIMVDIQMRVVTSETFGQAFTDEVIREEDDDSLTMSTYTSPTATPSTKIVYAIWVTYSRNLHAINHGIGPVSPLVSRPSTPPKQPSPGQAALMHDDSDTSSTHTSGTELTPPLPSAQVRLSRSSSATKLDAISPPPVATTGEFRKTMTINDFFSFEAMGEGAYGQVKSARPKTSAAPPIRQFSKVVIKYVTKRRILVDTWYRDRRLGTVPLEIHVLDYLKGDGLQHPSIVEMIDFFEDETNYYILMKPHGLPGMDLFDFIELRANLEEAECQKLFKQIASAVHFLHTKALVVHRDIKDENVILDGEGRIKLIDFGSASYIKNGPFDVFVGTIDYAAPEVLTGPTPSSTSSSTSPFSSSAPTGPTLYDGLAQDIWALGILLYTILYKENPFYSIDEIMDHELRVPYVVSDESIDLVRRMLERDVGGRIGIGRVVEHPWLEGVELVG